MADITDLTARRAQLLAQGIMAAYRRQRDAMRIAGIPSAEIAEGDDGETLVADVAACMTVANALPRVGLTSAVLGRMQASEEPAFGVLIRASRAYFASEQLRRDLGGTAAEPFRILRAVMPATG